MAIDGKRSRPLGGEARRRQGLRHRSACRNVQALPLGTRPHWPLLALFASIFPLADAPATGGHFRYFAYGSNMSTARLRERTSFSPSARHRPACRASMPCAGTSSARDGSGKCDALFTGDQADTVWGVLFDIAWAENLGSTPPKGSASVTSI